MCRHYLLTLPVLVLLGGAASAPSQVPRVDVRLVTDEPEAVLAILAKRAAGQPVEDSDWQRLFRSEGYQRLKKREASLKRDFEDTTFAAFVASPQLLANRVALQAILDGWRSVNVQEAAARAFAYLPSDAVIRAKIYPSIKPRPNTFVFETSTDPAIFFYLDPKISAARFENTLAHELHHIGYASACRNADSARTRLDANTRLALEWMGGFAEGRAVLAAAGSPDVHPHATSDSSERAVWERDYANAGRDLPRLEAFFLAIAEGRMPSEEEQNRLGMSFVNTDSVPQGPYYTVGYLMARTVEKQLGRARLVASTCDPARFLADYNRAAALQQQRGGARLPRWSQALLARVGRGLSGPPR